VEVLRNGEFHDLYSSSNTIYQINKNGMGGSCGTYVGRGDRHAGFWWGNLKVRNRMEDLDVDWQIILKMDLEELEWRAWNGFIRIRQVAGCCEHGNEHSGSIRYEEFLD
jgi:hypothetical protein